MRPLRLLLDGFGTYRNETEIDFTDVDFFALVGPTGSGKSTVIDALCFALYGTVPRWDNEKEVRNALAPSANACRVSLIFELSGERYVAVRSLQRDKNGRVSTKAARLERLDASIPPDAPLAEILEASAEQLAEGPDNVKTRVQDLLGLSYEHFTQSVLLPQGGFSDFLRATPANRQRLLVELLAFGVYKEIGQRARERAQLAETHQQLAQQARDQLADATQDAESAAAARLADLTALAAKVDSSLVTLTELHKQSADATDRLATAGNEAALLAAVRTPAEVGGLAQQIAAADSLVAAARQRRDDAAQVTGQADQARAGLPDKAETQRQLERYALRRELITEAELQATALATCREKEDKLAAELQAADLAVSVAQDAVDAAQRAHAAAGLAETLHVGDDCPVCRQQVATLPPRQAPADLSAARMTLETTTKAQRQARTAHQDAAKDAAAASSALATTQARLDKAALVMADAPSEVSLTRLLDSIAAADDALGKARTQAAARQTELAAAERSRDSLAAAEQRAWAQLSSTRDTLVVFGAPAIATGAGQDLAAAWATLGDWAAGETGARTSTLPQLQEAAAALKRQFDDSAVAVAQLLADHEVHADPLTKAPAAVAEQRARTEAGLHRIRADRTKAARLDNQIAAHKEDAQVAAMLGNLLRATSFERWLCSEALDSLVREASGTLMELSGGQYEIDRDERNDLVVIDYEDAGARRPVHTLSGGETFQASLALALALSRQVIGLSAGMRELNSMFLDEGFGTLDSDTLETVASTLERLAADSDRMVGVITHVAELADRVPVRFVVTRTGTTSTIVKERS
ncbi:MAG TPA: SMC family ATPase [Streptosporangiaceae bacterium]